MLNNLPLYTVCLSPLNHSSRFDVPSDSFTIILHTTPQFLIIKTMSHHPTLQHLRTLPYHKNLYRHHCTTFLHCPPPSPKVSTFPNPSSFCTPEPIPKYHPILSLVTPAMTILDDRICKLSWNHLMQFKYHSSLYSVTDILLYSVNKW